MLVALPFLREPETRDDRSTTPDRGRGGAACAREERDRALAALKELEFDHRTGKIGDDGLPRPGRPLRQAPRRR